MKKLMMLCIFTLTAVVTCLAENESITITTYYPSPYGEYRQLRSSELVVGGSGDPADFPTFSGALRLKPVTNPPPANTQPVGTFYFDDADKVFKYYNGTGDWQPMVGGSGNGITAGTLAGSGSFTLTLIGGTSSFACGTIVSPAVCPVYTTSVLYSELCKCEPGWIVYNRKCYAGSPLGTNYCSWICQKLP